MSRLVCARCAVGAILSFLMAGCGRGGGDPVAAPEYHLRMAAMAYGRYLGAHKGSPPASIEELKKFAKTLPSSEGKDLETMFVSPRDQQPYVLIAAGRGMPGIGAKTIVLHEKNGVDGKRFVAYSTTEVAEVDEEEFRGLTAKK